MIVSISDGNITEGLEFDKVAICAGVDTQKFANVLGDRMQVYQERLQRNHQSK